MKLKFIYCVLFFFFLFSSIALGDDAVFDGRGETVWPIESKDIEMVAETVLVKRENREWKANCIFILRNLGEAAEVQVGFPELMQRGAEGDSTKSTIRNFTCFVDGKKIPAEYKKGIKSPMDPRIEYPFAYVWKMYFEKGQTRVVRNTYSFNGVLVSNGATDVSYVLKTGALWKGRVRFASVTIDLGKADPGFVLHIEPKGFIIRNNQISWIFRDFEPDSDIIVEISTGLTDWIEEAGRYTKTDSVRVLERLLNEADWLLDRGIPEKFQREFNDKVNWLINQYEKRGNVIQFESLKARITNDKAKAVK